MKKIVIAIAAIFLTICTFAHDHEKMPPKRNPAVPYHGRRLPADAESFFVNSISSNINYQYEYESIELTIHFSFPIDPRSVSQEEILINRKKISPRSKFGYNKAGNVLRIKIDDAENLNLDDESFFSLELYGLRSFDGQPLEREFFGNVPFCDRLIFFSERPPRPKNPPPGVPCSPKPNAVMEDCHE